MGFLCSLTGRRYIMGKGSESMVRIQYALDGIVRDVTLSDRAIDSLIELSLNGPIILEQEMSKPIGVKVMRVALVEGRLQCLHCSRTHDTHMFVKFDNLRVAGNRAIYTERLCAQCVIAYLEMLTSSNLLKRRKKVVYECPSLQAVSF
jgi:hypothetical protein